MKIQTIVEKRVPIIVVAAGRGQRAGEGLPKQYRQVAGKTVLRHTLDNLLSIDSIGEIQVVIHPNDLDLYQNAVKGLSILAPVYGGETRQQSVSNGLSSLRDKLENIESTYIFIHDAARPFTSEIVINDLVKALISGADAVIPGVEITDTIKKCDDGGTVVTTIDRTNLHRVQTPQGFVVSKLQQVHDNPPAGDNTDDAMMMESAGHKVTITKGDEDNFKITKPDDFLKAELMITNKCNDIRVGQGYDVHRFESGDNLWLCGVKIPHEMSLKGHSDADVALHALTDAILSAIAAGDIGTHFPPSDDKWRGASSDIFLKKACDLVQEKSGIISHLAVTIICEAPKIGPHMMVMRQKISDITNIELDRISVQATTTEKLGFTGRSEGIAAQATATIRLP